MLQTRVPGIASNAGEEPISTFPVSTSSDVGPQPPNMGIQLFLKPSERKSVCLNKPIFALAICQNDLMAQTGAWGCRQPCVSPL